MLTRRDEALFMFEKYFGKYERFNEELSELLDEDEKQTDQEAFTNRYSEFKQFLHKTNEWIAKLIKDPQKEDEEGEDSHVSASKSSSVASSSSTSSAKLRIKAEREALLARAAALKKKEAIEQEELRLKLKKEQLEIEKELAASNAKLKVYEEFEDAQVTMGAFEPPAEPKTESRCGRQREQSTDHVDESERRNSSTRSEAFSSTPHQDRQDHTDSSFDGLYGILQRQNEVTKMLIKKQSVSQLPHKDIPVFRGDPLTYRSFIRAFEHAIDSNTESHKDRLYYLEQFTSGEPLDLIRSCEHMRPDKAYKEARALLDRHYGDELTIATAYIKKAMEWPQIKSEDRMALNIFALFVIRCWNTVNDVDYIEEMKNPTNMKCILSKLPFKLKERWRSYAFDIEERTKKRARFSDLVDFVYHQARIANDPFGDILDSTSSAPKSLKKKLGTVKTESKRSSFAANVSVEKDASKDHVVKKTTVKTVSVFQSPCLYCQNNHALNMCNKTRDKPLKERIQLLKSNGLCFGCLTAGHLSKDCKKKASCPDCSLKHPDILHVVKEEAASEQNSADDSMQGSSEVTSALVSAGCKKGEYTGDGNSDCILPNVPV